MFAISMTIDLRISFQLHTRYLCAETTSVHDGAH